MFGKFGRAVDGVEVAKCRQHLALLVDIGAMSFELNPYVFAVAQDRARVQECIEYLLCVDARRPDLSLIHI